MKKPHWFSRTHRVSYLRVASAVTLLAAGVAIAIVGTQSEPKRTVRKSLRGDPDAAFERTMPGINAEGGPMAAALEDYAHRAYPATEVPMDVTRRATQSWQAFQAAHSNRVNATDVNPPLLNWNLFGPSVLNSPAVLTFSGAPATISGRITAMALDSTCDANVCRMWIAAAGGGIWRTNNVHDATPSWTFVSGSFATNAIGTLTFAGGVLYAGTGEPNASADSEAGFGIYKSLDGGNTWTHLASQTTVPQGAGVDCTAVGFAGAGVLNAPAYSGPAFDGRAVSQIVVDPSNPNTLYVGSARAARGLSSTSSGGVFTIVPGFPPFGLWKSTDAGATFTLLNYEDVCLNPALPANGGISQSSFGSSRGVHAVAIDPNDPAIVYAAPFPQLNAIPAGTKGGVWRSIDGGTNWVQIKNARNPASNADRASFAVTALPGNKTRMYVGAGNNSTGAANQAHLFRNDDAAVALDADFQDLTVVQEASAAKKQTLNYCGYSAGGQCSYDNVVYTPAGKPDVVFLGGVFDYDNYGGRNNGRAFLRSTDAGLTFTDMTWDATNSPTPPDTCCQPNPIAPNGMHPDQHAMIEIPGTEKQIYGSDGGLTRSSGVYSDISAQCTARGLAGDDLLTCQQLLKAVPSVLSSINPGLSTLQYQSVAVATDNNGKIQGGTQDNGTSWGDNSPTWSQSFFGDGGNGGISSTDSALRVNTFTGNAHAANFGDGDPLRSYLISGPIIASGESAQFYPPIIADPSTGAGETIFEGSKSVWRTQDWGGPEPVLDAGNCNIFLNNPLTCGDFLPIGPPGATDLTASNADYRGTTRAGGNMAFLARTPEDTTTLWAATSNGRLFVSQNADAPAPAVTFVRIDTLDANSPNRYISSIFIDRANPNHAWVTYSSYNVITPALPGHVFSVVYDPAGPTATWTSLDGSGPTGWPDFPALSVVATPNGDIFVSNDYSILRLPVGSTDWEVAGTGLPMVTTSALVLSPDGKKLYAATHGRSVFVADVPDAQAATAMTTQATPTATLGEEIHDTATLTGGNAPTGTITFKLYGPDDDTCAGSVIFTSVVTVAGNGSYTSASFTPSAPGTYRWTATYSGDNANASVSTACNDANETTEVGGQANGPQALNLSTRMRVDINDHAGIGGFIISGNTPKHVIIRAIGPSLTKFGFSPSEVLADPTLEVQGNGFGTVTNNNWRDTQEAQIKADGLPPTNDLESAIDATLPPGAYTATVRGNVNGTGVGIALVEVYDLDTAANSKLANLSTRAFVGTGSDVVIAGFVLGNNTGSDRVVVTGRGPSLAAFGITDPLADPTLELRDSNGVLLTSNNDWQDDPTQAAELANAGLAPGDPKESAIAATLPPGLYTAILAGVNGGTGVGVVEVYDRGP